MSLLIPASDASGAIDCRLVRSGLAALMASGVRLQRKDTAASVWAAVGRNTRPQGQHSPLGPHAWQPVGHATPGMFKCVQAVRLWSFLRTCACAVGGELSVGDASLAHVVAGAGLATVNAACCCDSGQCATHTLARFLKRTAAAGQVALGARFASAADGGPAIVWGDQASLLDALAFVCKVGWAVKVGVVVRKDSRGGQRAHCD